MIENNSITKRSLIYGRLKIMSQLYHNFMIYPESVINCLSSISSFLVVLVIIDYVLKWIEAMSCRNNDSKTVIKFLRENILS